MSSKYDNLADKTAANLVADRLMSSYRMLKELHPEIGGLHIEMVELGDDGAVNTKIELLRPAGTMKRKDANGNNGKDYVIV